MVKKRLLNCDFVNASSFKVKLSNKAKLLYLLMFANADDFGFVDTTSEIVESLEQNDLAYNGEQVSLTLLENDYKSALLELLEKGLLYEFRNNHNCRVHLIRHWYFHVVDPKKKWTNYFGYLKFVSVVNAKYVLKEKVGKEKEIINNSNVKYSNVNNESNNTNIEDDWSILVDELEKSKPKEKDYGEQ